MIDLGEVFLAAWATLKPHLDTHPDELRLRLARRHTARLQRPLREWAIALRANDRRLTPMRAAIIPADAPAHLQPHPVEIDGPSSTSSTAPSKPTSPTTSSPSSPSASASPT